MNSSGPARLQTLSALYRRGLLILFALLPLGLIVYLHHHQVPTDRFEDHTFHIIAISIAILLGLFISYITWRCYRETGEVFLRWLTLGFLGFSIVYAPHGLLTPLAHHNPWLFLLYGPASRLVMAICFVVALLRFGVEVDEPGKRQRPAPWWLALGIFLLIDILVFGWAVSPWRDNAVLRIGMEYSVIIMFGVSLLWMAIHKIFNPLMIIYALAMAWFAQSSFGFTLGLMWDHQWWLAHVIFAGGFLLLSYGVIQAWLSTRSFTWVYDQHELMVQLREQKQRAEKAMVDLQYANQELERLAATDSLTGAANRRELMNRAEQELDQARRHDHSLSLVLLDLDHFKSINDNYGHPVGDAVLRAFVKRCEVLLRPGDVLGRVGGEEFAILLPQTAHDEAVIAAERLRNSLDSEALDADGESISITISAGVVEFTLTGNLNEEFKRADQRLYRAKQAGRNRVESA